MSYIDISDLFLVVAMACGGILVLIIAGLILPSIRRSSSILTNKKLRLSLLEDYRNPKIIAGGPIGIIRKLFITGLVFLILGGLVRLIGLL